MTARKESGRGGARPGSGRPAELRDATRVTFHIEKADLDMLKRRAETAESTVGELLRAAAKAYLKGRRK